MDRYCSHCGFATTYTYDPPTKCGSAKCGKPFVAAFAPKTIPQTIPIAPQRQPITAAIPARPRPKKPDSFDIASQKAYKPAGVMNEDGVYEEEGFDGVGFANYDTETEEAKAALIKELGIVPVAPGKDANRISVKDLKNNPEFGQRGTIEVLPDVSQFTQD